MRQSSNMRRETKLWSFLFLFLVDVVVCEGISLSRNDFPPDFVFGAGNSAYQVEGAGNEDGRGPSILDTFGFQGRTADDIVSNQYHKYKDDVKLMKKMGLDAYRLSLSWSRIIPDGNGAVNPKGLTYYNNLIDELVNNGIEPIVTLSHFDTPQALEDQYLGLLSPRFINDFTAYADVCFKAYGDRVKSWVTLNEPNLQTIGGYDEGIMPPSRCSYPFGNCSNGDSTTEPYIAAHHLLLAHASAVELYRTTYQEKQNGQIGITFMSYWYEPLTTSHADVTAAKRILDFQLGWCMDPIVYGRYPAVMRKIVGDRLPKFSETESKRIKGSFDFIGINHYYGLYAQDISKRSSTYGSDYDNDISVKTTRTNGTRDITGLEVDGMYITEWGLQRLLEYIRQYYNNPTVMIHENGLVSSPDDPSDPKSLIDTERIDYLRRYIHCLLPLIRDGVNVKGYFVWSFIDSFEYFGGCYGLFGVDFTDKNRTRYPRQSAHWYSNFLEKTGSMNVNIKCFGRCVEGPQVD